MSDEIVRSLLVERRDAPHLDRYDKGLFSSYVRRAEDTLRYAIAIGARTDARQREHKAGGLARASEQVCKAIRVANGQSATRSRDARALIFGNGSSIEPVADDEWRRSLTPLTAFADAAVWTDELLGAWASLLTTLVERAARVEPAPRRPARASRLALPPATKRR